MLQLWKAPHILKGTLTYLGPLYRWYLARHQVSGTSPLEQHYSSWHECMSLLTAFGFRPEGRRMVELGPGDTLGVGLAALLSGVRHYTALDVVPSAQECDLVSIFDELSQMAANQGESNRQVLLSDVELQRIRTDLACGIDMSDVVRYQVPWSASSVPESSVDLVSSKCVLDYIDSLEETFEAIYRWLRPGGYSYHWIVCNAQWISPYWNGHWAYSDLEWRLVRGRRPFLVNREPISTYERVSKAVGFDVLLTKPRAGEGGLRREQLAARFREMNARDSTTRGAHLILRKPIEEGRIPGASS